MIFKVTFKFNGETWWKYYKTRTVSAVLRYLLGGFTKATQVWEVKRVLRLPKGVEPIKL